LSAGRLISGRKDRTARRHPLYAVPVRSAITGELIMPTHVQVRRLDGFSIRVDLDPLPRKQIGVRTIDPKNQWIMSIVEMLYLYHHPDGFCFQCLETHMQYRDKRAGDQAIHPLAGRLDIIRIANEIPPGELPPELTPPPTEVPDLVTLDQAAAVVRKKKRTLERFKTSGELPAPVGKSTEEGADMWDWKVLRPWLENQYRMRLPERYPHLQKQ
jgi:hypothetical protein